jgi:hypothetical protein
MKNFDLLPLDEIQMQRVKKFAEMHQRYGGIIIDVIAGDKVSGEYLIRVKDKKGSLNIDSLIQKAQEVFAGEVPEDLRLYFTVMEEEDSKYYLTWDHRHVIRVHKYFQVWDVEKDFLNPDRQQGPFKSLFVNGTKGETAKALSWFKHYVITHNVQL